MSLPDYALATLDEVKQYLGVADDDRDEELGALIADVSRTILAETGREYAPKTPAADDDDPVDRTLAYRVGSTFIDLAPYEAREVTAVTIDEGGDYETVLAATSWQLRPIATATGVRDRIHLAPGARITRCAGWDRLPVTVTGRWGWPEVPADVVGWLKELVEDRFREDLAFYADADGDVSSTGNIESNGRPTTIPFRIRDAMIRARRPYVGRP